MLRCYDQTASVVINNPNGILLANEKCFGHQVAPKLFPDTLVATNKDVIMEFIKEHKKVVLKPLFEAGGSGILVFDYNDRNLLSALEILSGVFSTPVMVQSYIENARQGDKRIIVLGGKAIGAITRMPQEHDHRADLHAGGTVKGTHLDDRDLEITKALAPHLLALGLHFVGLDVIDGYLTEINVTSPTCIIEIERLSQKSEEKPIRAQVLDYVEGLIA